MLKQVFFYSVLLVMLASCSSLKTAFTGSRDPAAGRQSPSVKKQTKFLDEIDVPVESTRSKKEEGAIIPVAKKETQGTRILCCFLEGI